MNIAHTDPSTSSADMPMLAYYARLGFRSLRRNPLLTLLMVMAIGFGVASSMTTFAVFRAVSGDPLPNKSNQLFVPQLDNWGPRVRSTPTDLPNAFAYQDAVAMLRDHAAAHQTVTYPVQYSLVPADANADPVSLKGYAATSDFFAMFDVPFTYGSGWSPADDASRANAVVISAKLNQRLFGGSSSVGRVVNLDGHDYRIAGVIGAWNPRPRFYDVVNGNAFGDSPDFFVPLSHAIDLQTQSVGSTGCAGSAGQDPGFAGLLRSECVWLAYWVELPDRAAVQRYNSYLQGYAAQQQHAGRFHWAPNVRLLNLTQWLDEQQVVPPETKVSLVISLGFFLVCLVNTIGLMLAKFMRRASEIGVRRALGASRRQIYLQFLAEAAMVGLAGGVLGLLLTFIGVFGIGLVFEPAVARLARVDLGLVGMTLLVAMLATVVAAFYPTWRAARVQPAWQLKSN